MSKWTLSTYQFGQQLEFSWMARDLTPVQLKKARGELSSTAAAPGSSQRFTGVRVVSLLRVMMVVSPGWGSLPHCVNEVFRLLCPDAW